MATTSTVPMLAPNGQSGDVPINQVDKAKTAGFKVALQMESPDGKLGYIPADRQQDALQAGFKMHPVSVPDAQQPSYWDALTNPVGAGGRDQGVIGGALQVGGQAIKAMVQPVAHPIDTATGIYNMVAHPKDTVQGIVQNFQNDKANGGLPLAVENATGQLLGSVEGGRVLAAASKPAVSAATKVGAKVLNSTAEKLYGTAMKPATTLSAADRTAMVRTGLDNALPVSPAGVEKLGSLIDDLNQKIKNVVNTDPTRPIDPNAVATRADISKQRFTNQVNATKDLNSIENSRQQFLQERGAKPGSPAVAPQPTGILDSRGNPIMTGGSPATPPQPAPPMRAIDAQAMKQGTYSVLRDKYGEQGAAAVEAQKNLAMGLKEELANQFPELSSLNATESKLLDLGPVLERAVNRVSNNHTIGIGGPILGSAIKAGTGSSGAAAAIGLMKSIMDVPAVKSRLAISLSKAAKIPYPRALGRVSAYSASLESAAHGSQAYSTGDTPSQ